MTARALTGDRERCLAIGMDDYISKPIQQEAFIAAIGRLLPSCVAEPVGDNSGGGPTAIK